MDSLIEADPPEVLAPHEGLPADGAAAPGLQGGLEAAPAEDVAAAAGAHKTDPSVSQALVGIHTDGAGIAESVASRGGTRTGTGGHGRDNLILGEVNGVVS